MVPQLSGLRDGAQRVQPPSSGASNSPAWISMVPDYWRRTTTLQVRAATGTEGSTQREASTGETS